MADARPRAHGPDRGGSGSLLTRLYDDLRAQAARLLRNERADHTLSPTALVHEAYMKLAGGAGEVKDSVHFAALASTAMRRALVDHARARAAAKRRPEDGVLRLDSGLALTPRSPTRPIDVLALHQALETLASLHQRQARLVEMRFFGGLTTAQAAAALDISLATAEADWRMARTWLHRELSS